MSSLQRLPALRSILLIAAASLQLAAPWPNRLTRTTVCRGLHVTHPGQNTILARGNVSLVLLKNGREVSCYNPGEDYDVELRSNYKQMMGVLWILDPITGEFPLGPAPRNTKKNSVCQKPHISHYCEDQSGHGCILGEDGMSLTVGYRAPSLNDLHTLVVFRYTVVFKKHEYLVNEEQHFERCSSETTTPPDADTSTVDDSIPESDPLCSNESPDDNGNRVQPEDNNLTALNSADINLTNEPEGSQGVCNTFEPSQGANALGGHCGIHKLKSNESRPYTDPSTLIDYICSIYDQSRYARKVTCENRCEKNGEQRICRVKNTLERKRTFICRPTSDFPNFGIVYREFTVKQQSQCECYQLSDVNLTCPTASPRCRTTTQATPATPTTPSESNRPY